MFTLIYTVVAVGANFAMLTMVGGAFADALTYSYRYCMMMTNKKTELKTNV
jgi:hypothetical protein